MSSAAPSSFDPELIDQTRQQLRTLVQEIEGLAKSEATPGEFYEGFLNRIVAALAAIGGAIWTLDDSGRLTLGYQLNLQQTRLAESEQNQQRHAQLLHKVVTEGQGLLVPPQSAAEGTELVNPTDCLLILAALKSDKQVQAIVEVFQRPGNRPTIERGYLRFVLQMCELAGDYLKTRHLRSFADRQVMWSQLEQFTRLVHESLDPRQTAYTIANEGRRLIGCDRVTVALLRGRRCRVEAVSGQELIDQRSNTVAMIGKLASIVVAGGEPLWYSGDTSNLPPQIEQAVESYADESHSKMVAVLPLEKPRGEKDDDRREPEFLGALVIEQITDDNVSESMRRRIDVVAEHSALALANAREHQDLFLMPVWRAIGKSRFLVQARTLPKTLLAIGGLLAVILALVLIPANLELAGRGTLEPVGKREIFAGVDGTVDKINIQHGDIVEAGQVLIELRNSDLEANIADVAGKLAATTDQRISSQRSLSDNRLSREERDRLEGQAAQYRQTERSLEKQLKIYREKQKQLRVLSPIKGQVVTWQLQEKLLARPVEKGQLLLTIADNDGRWELDIHMPEDRMGDVVRQANRLAAEAKGKSDSPKPLQVSYILGTNPGSRHAGTVRDIEPSAQVIGDEGSVVLIKVDIDKKVHDPADLRPGASVTAKVNCGRASLGYVWFHDLIGFVQSRILFRL